MDGIIQNTIRLLIIEDDPEDIVFMKENLKDSYISRFNLTIAENLTTAVELLASEKYDLILLDLGLPESKGLETFNRIRNHSGDIPVVILTGCDDKELGIKAIQNGGQDYLVKGNMNNDMLIRVVRYAIERCRLQSELEKIREKQQQFEEREELLRSRDQYRAMSEGERQKGFDTLPDINADVFDKLFSEYRDISLKYIRAIRLGEERPVAKVHAFAGRLTGLNVRAETVVKIHLRLLHEISIKITPQEERAFSNDARLVLVEILGNMSDIQLLRLLTMDKN
jgi:DNA-binding response OmpR family regulator